MEKEKKNVVNKCIYIKNERKVNKKEKDFSFQKIKRNTLPSEGEAFWEFRAQLKTFDGKKFARVSLRRQFSISKTK